MTFPICAKKQGFLFLFPFSHLYFSTRCGKRSGKPKKACPCYSFPMLKKDRVFNCTSFQNPYLSLFADVFHSLFLIKKLQKRNFMVFFPISTKLFTFRAFPQGTFSTFPTREKQAKVFPISKKVFPIRSHRKRKVIHSPKTKPLPCFSALFPLFDIP